MPVPNPPSSRPIAASPIPGKTGTGSALHVVPVKACTVANHSWNTSSGGADNPYCW